MIKDIEVKTKKKKKTLKDPMVKEWPDLKKNLFSVLH